MGDSKENIEQCMDLIATADREFGQLGLKCKQWTVSGQKPSPAVSDDGLCLLIGGFGWFPEDDSVSVRIPPKVGPGETAKKHSNFQILRKSQSGYGELK